MKKEEKKSMIAKWIKKFKVWILDTFYNDFEFGIQVQNNQISNCTNLQFIFKYNNLYINKAVREDIQDLTGTCIIINEGEILDSENNRIWV